MASLKWAIQMPVNPPKQRESISEEPPSYFLTVKNPFHICYIHDNIRVTNPSMSDWQMSHVWLISHFYSKHFVTELCGQMQDGHKV